MNKQRGIVKLALSVIIIVVLLAVLKIDVRRYARLVWNDYVAPFVKGEFLEGARGKTLERRVLPDE